MPGSATKSEWSALADASPEARLDSMIKAFAAIAVLDDEARVGNCAALLDQEAELDAKAIQTMAASRFRALAAMDPDAAGRVSSAYAKAEQRLSGTVGMGRVPAVQAAAKGLSLDEISKIEPFMPSIREMAGLAPARREQPIAAGDLAVAAPEPRKGLFAKLFSRS
jgi:hypothetical protein